MKKIPLLLICAFLGLSVKAQNCHDPYDFNLLSGTCVGGGGQATLNFEGEYQFFFVNNNWSSLVSTNAVTYTFEVVSYPFWPDCITSQCGTTNTTRILKILPANSLLAAMKFSNEVGKPAPNIVGVYGSPSVNAKDGFNLPSSLGSVIFLGASPSNRVVYPHAIIKHTFRLHSGKNTTDPVIESFDFILDHTRGRMRDYPYHPNNSLAAQTESYDVTGFPDFNCSSVESFFNHNLNVDLRDAVGKYNSGYECSGSIFQKNQGVTHTYIIDKQYDLTKINSPEATIYNPLEVDIDINNLTQPFIFPKGYTFKTVQGTYPTLSQIVAADPNNLYPSIKDVPVSSTLTLQNDPSTATIDERKSYYRIKSGSKLIIEACVSIYDAEIEVQTGGVLEYDPTVTYGNFTINNTGGTVSVQNFSQTSPCSRRCYDINLYSTIDFPVTSNLTISANQTIAGTLTVKSGVTLTINAGVQMKFGPKGKIVVEPGGKLIANGSNGTEVIFSSACQDIMWQGIEVWGNRTLGQDPVVTTPQGYLELNYAIVENALDAVTLEDPQVVGKEGGIVRATNSIFRDNRRDAQFISYQNKPCSTCFELNNRSFFKNCKFLTTKYLASPIFQSNGKRFAAPAHISMWDVKNVAIEDCQFENQAISLFDPARRGGGIFSIDASFSLSQAHPNTFTGLTMAIYANDPLQSNLIKIDGCGFVNNIWGVLLEGSQYSSITRSTFQIPASSQIGYKFTSGEEQNEGFDKPVGLYLIGSSYFNVEENVFLNFGAKSQQGISQDYFNYGIVCNNAALSVGTSNDGGGFASIYKNAINNVSIGVQTELDNKGNGLNSFSSLYMMGTGLDIKCNSFSGDVEYDVTNVGKKIGFSTVFGDLRFQGICLGNNVKSPAGNQFIGTCPANNQLEVGSLGQTYDYSFHNSGITTPACPDGINLQPTCIPPFVLNSACPSNLTGGGNNSANLLGLISSNLSTAAQLKTQLDALIDGGNTGNLINIIATGTPGQIKSALLSYSPYLSDSVLIAAINRNPSLSQGILKQIILANSSVTDEVLDALNNANIPQGTMNSINSAQNGVSARKEKEKEIDFYVFQAHLASAQLVRLYLEQDKFDSVITVLQLDSSFVGKCRLVPWLIEKGDFVQAQQALTFIIAALGGLPDDHCKMQAISLDLAQNGKTWFDISQTQRDTINAIIDRDQESFVLPQGVLRLIDERVFPRSPYPFIQNNQRISGKKPRIETSSPTSELKIYPNPSNNIVNTETVLPEGVEDAVLNLYNVLGAEVQSIKIEKGQAKTILNISELPEGIYLCQLRNKNALFASQKLLIIR